ncbi:MAG TPA: family 16 glycoside hydrolase [Ktedonobacteraceae bacterium]|nr:family 16 glycoside hydrolase [Ktedonobacteraceae bacterium]
MMRNSGSRLSKRQVWSIIVAVGVILGIVSSCIAIYEFPSFFSNMRASGVTPTPGASQPAPGNTPTQGLTITPEPTQPLSPSPSGTLPYQADASWSGWSGTKEWNILNGMLTNNGSGYPGQPTILAPVVLSVSDYAVEAKIQVVNWPRCCYSQFAIVVRASNGSGYWQGYSVGVDLQNPSAEISAHAGDFGSLLGNAPFDPGAGWHTYRVEVKGDTIKLLIDGGVKMSLVDNSYLSGGQVGFWSYEVQLNISSFKIVAL